MVNTKKCIKCERSLLPVVLNRFILKPGGKITLAKKKIVNYQINSLLF